MVRPLLIVITTLLCLPAAATFGLVWQAKVTSGDFQANTSGQFYDGQLDLIAHQGGNLEFPDSTLPAFDAAYQLPRVVLEFDVHLSKDGEMMVMHDARVDRTTNGTGAIRSLTLAELKQLDAAYWWPYHPNDDISKQRVPSNQQFPFRGKGISIPTLSELFDRYPGAHFVIELKDNTPELRTGLLKHIDKYNLWSRVLIASFYHETLEAIRSSEPRAQTYGAEADIRLFYWLHLLHLESLFPSDTAALALPMKAGPVDLATPRFMAAARSSGVLLHYWTINREDDMTRLISLGVDGIMTDRPALLNQRLYAPAAQDTNQGPAE